MRLLTELSDNFSQQTTITTEDGKTFIFYLDYYEGQQAWFWGLEYNTFSIQGQRLVLEPNFLRRFTSSLPFGMTCLTDGKQVDPFLLDDFTNGRIQLYLLTSTEAAALEADIYGN